MKNILTISINSPDKMIWEGKGTSVSSVNSMGPFDILPQHANFITIIENTPIIIKGLDKVLEYQFPLCLMYARDNYVYAYTI